MCKKIKSIRKVLSDRRSHRDTEHPYDIAIILYPGGCVKGIFVVRGYGLVRRGRPVKAARLWEFRGSWPAASSQLLIWPCQKGRFRLYYTKKVVFNILLEIKERYL